MKIAVASSDGIVINAHFGKADSFYIYDYQGEVIRLIEKRIGKPFCHFGEHDETKLTDAVELLADCAKVYVLQIGKGAEEALFARGIQTVIARGIITEVLESNEKGV
jgi:predicted Fe-Mo cluster-binding NifX family protein